MRHHELKYINCLKYLSFQQGILALSDICRRNVIMTLSTLTTLTTLIFDAHSGLRLRTSPACVLCAHAPPVASSASVVFVCLPALMALFLGCLMLKPLVWGVLSRGGTFPRH